MKITAAIDIQAPREKVWHVITDHANWVNIVEAIEAVDVLEQPEQGLVGFKWRETRTMFGKKATEEMLITEAEQNSHYSTVAESHGAIYESTTSIEEQNGMTRLTMAFEGRPRTTGAKIMAALMGWMFKGATRKALQKDLEDIKAHIESQA